MDTNKQITPNNQQAGQPENAQQPQNNQQQPGGAQPQASAAQPNPQQNANNSQNDAVDNANGYGAIGIEEVDMLLMEDEDALDVDNSMYMDATDSADSFTIDFLIDDDFDDTYTAAGAGIDADDYANALDTVDIFVSEYDAMPNTDEDDANFAEAQDAGVSWAHEDPLTLKGSEDDCGCSL